MIGKIEEMTCVVAVKQDTDYYKGKQAPNIHAITDALTVKLGSSLQYIPEGFHLTVASTHAQSPDYADNFIKYLKEIVPTIDVNAQPTSKQGSAYFTMGQVSAFGVSILPSEVARKLGEAAMVGIYDFHADPKFDKLKVPNKEFDRGQALTALLTLAFSVILLVLGVGAISENPMAGVSFIFLHLYILSIGLTSYKDATTFPTT